MAKKDMTQEQVDDLKEFIESKINEIKIELFGLSGNNGMRGTIKDHEGRLRNLEKPNFPVNQVSSPAPAPPDKKGVHLQYWQLIIGAIVSLLTSGTAGAIISQLFKP